jgi:hypothetical protein
MLKNCVSLVCTVHEEKGAVTVSALLEILERIRPEVIFAEMPPAAIDDYFTTCARANLESKAIRRYRDGHEARIIPVDLPTPDEAFFRNNRLLFEKIEQQSAEYCRHIDLHSAYVAKYGFAYLNSEYCSKLWVDVDAEIRRTIECLNDARLNELFQLWRNTIDGRDDAMMKNILRYCSSESFDKGVFLVGASHRQFFIDKGKEQSAAHPDRIQWSFSTA